MSNDTVLAPASAPVSAPASAPVRAPACASVPSTQSERPPSLERPGWTLVWHDEFDGDSLDRSKWDFDLGNGFVDAKTGEHVPGWGNEELQTYTDSPTNVSIHNSVLTIRAVKERVPVQGCGYTSARLKTRRRDGAALFSKRYGRFEFRAKVPWGKGLWPALWLLPQDEDYGGWAASGEIDVMEIVGEKPHQVLNSIHFGSVFPKRELITHVHTLPEGELVSDWHVYAVEWEAGEMRFFVDDVLTCTHRFWWSCSTTNAEGAGQVPTGPHEINPWPAPFDKPFYLVMNVAVGGNFPGAPNEATQFPAELAIDYVRVYDPAVTATPPAPDTAQQPALPRGPGLFPWQISAD